MNIPPGFWDNSQCEALSAMKCGRKKPDFAEYQEIRADKFHQEEKIMAKNYESSESKNSRNHTGTSDKSSYGNEMNYTDDVKNSTKNSTKNKTSQSYSSEEDRY